MQTKKRFPVLLLAIVISISTLFSACSASGGSGTATTTRATTTARGTTQQITEARITVSMFMGNSGLAHPQGIDPSNNDFINIVKEFANVDLIVEVPAYDDIGTKFSLLLSSGNLPDLIHNSYKDESNQAGDSGAFLDLRAYYDNSELVKKYVNEQMMELAKAPSGKNYRIPMAWDAAPRGYGNYSRYDLLVKYNNSVWPTSVDEWVEYLRKIKREIPDSVPISWHNSTDMSFLYGQTFFFWYGAMPYEFRIDNGKVSSTFTLPEYKEAVALFKQLYQEGILDKEFATNNQDKRLERIQNNSTVLQSDGADQIFGLNQWFRAKPGSEDFVFAYAPELKVYPAVLKDVKYAKAGYWTPITWHGLYISSKTQYPDRVWRVIEGFASDELYDAIFWGKEGVEHTVVNGERIPNAEKLADTSRSWSLHLALIYGFVAGQDSKMAVQKQLLGDEIFNVISGSLKEAAAQTDVVGVRFDAYVNINDFDGVAEKISESNQFITQATVQAIMGVISMDAFDTKVKEYITRYGFIADAQTDYIRDNKDELLRAGIKSAGW